MGSARTSRFGTIPRRGIYSSLAYRSAVSGPENKTRRREEKPTPVGLRQRRLGSATAPASRILVSRRTSAFGRPDLPDDVSPATRPAHLYLGISWPFPGPF